MLWVRLKQTITGGAETILSVAVTLVFFLLFLGSLTFIFPSGIVLRNAMTSNEIFGTQGASAGSRAMVEGALGAGGIGSGGNPLTAVLTVLKRDVKTKSANHVAWSTGRSGRTLHVGDAVQTARDGRALVEFEKSAHFRLGRNSLIVIREQEERGSTAPRGPSLLVLEGDLWVASSSTGDARSPIRIETPQGVAYVETSEDAQPVELKVAVARDRSATISVYKGAAEVSVGEDKVHVGASESVLMDATNPVLEAVELPPAPKPTAPAAGTVYRIREVSPRIQLDWKPIRDVDAYRVVIARDRDFREVVVDDRIAQATYTIGNLSAGTYRWRVTAFKAGAEGPASRSLSFSIAQDDRAPELNVVYPAEAVDGDQCTITGSTEPGVRVFVGGKQVVTKDTGQFEHVISLDRGLNVVVVEAVDSAGNTAYSSKVVDANF